MKYFAKIKQLLIPGFLLNFLWESLQSKLYEYHFNGLLDFIVVHTKASLGDVVIIMFIYLLGSLIFKDSSWFTYLNKLKIFYTILSGSIFGLMVEKICLQTGRWSYDQSMPLIPLLRVGLSPILQMTILPLATFAIAKRQLKSP